MERFIYKKGAGMTSSQLLVQVLRNGLAREEEKIEIARVRIWELKKELLELGVELPVQDSEDIKL